MAGLRVDDYDGVAFDCDGVLWRGSELIEGAKEVLDEIAKCNKSRVFITNNARTSREGYVEKFKRFGIDVSADEILCSAQCAAAQVRLVCSDKKRPSVYMIGESGLEQELQKAGIDVVTTETPDAVVCGLDFNFTYAKLAQAHVHLNSNIQIPLIATNNDSTYPFSDSVTHPGAGALLSSLLTSANMDKRPFHVCGKPHEPMQHLFKTEYMKSARRWLMVGDRLDTDIEFGRACGMETCLVLTGVASQQDVDASAIKPTFVLKSIADII